MLCKILPLKTCQAKELMVIPCCRCRCVLRALCVMVCVVEPADKLPAVRSSASAWMLCCAVGPGEVLLHVAHALQCSRGTELVPAPGAAPEQL